MISKENIWRQEKKKGEKKVGKAKYCEETMKRLVKKKKVKKTRKNDGDSNGGFFWAEYFFFFCLKIEKSSKFE